MTFCSLSVIIVILLLCPFFSSFFPRPFSFLSTLSLVSPSATLSGHDNFINLSFLSFFFFFCALKIDGVEKQKVLSVSVFPFLPSRKYDSLARNCRGSADFYGQ